MKGLFIQLSTVSTFQDSKQSNSAGKHSFQGTKIERQKRDLSRSSDGFDSSESITILDLSVKLSIIQLADPCHLV